MTISRVMRVALVALLAAAPAVGSAGVAQAQVEPAAFDETKTITNGGTGERFSARVRVSQTANLFNRQQVAIELNGFKPTYNANNTENTGVYMEYPVVVMQCHSAEPTPRTCPNERRSVWYAGYDKNASTDDKTRARRLSAPGSVVGFPGADFYEQLTAALPVEQQRFDAVDGVGYLWNETVHPVTGKPLIDEPTLRSYPPPDTASDGVSVINTRTVPIRPDGTSEVLFEVRQRASLPSLGCTDTQACSLVVVPIMDLPCATDAPAGCAAPPGGNPPGSVGDGPTNINEFLSQRAWFAESNWRNRFVVPVSFAPDPSTCSVQDPRPTLPVFGSELADVAQQRWGAAYCASARPADYLPVYSQGSEYHGRRQFNTQLGPRYQQDAVLTTQPVTESPRPVVHAPSVLTGFTVAFTIDDGTGKQVQELTLSPRLLAKLLTQSYSPGAVLPAIRDARTRYTGTEPIASRADAAKYYWEHPTVWQNTKNLWADEEFLALNPELELTDHNGRVVPQFGALRYVSPVIFQVQSDIIVDLTRYITSDPAARAWLDGTPDEQGMTVNPLWQGMRPFELYSLLDQEVRPPSPRATNWSETAPQYFAVVGAGDECDRQFRTPMLTRRANITNSAEAAATALLDRRGSATPLCGFVDVPVTPPQPNPGPGENPNVDRTYSERKDDPAEFGNRAVLSVTTVAHAGLYELPTAKLVNSAGVAVAPQPGTMLAALAAAKQDPATGTVAIDHTRVTGNAYPGTMVAFTAAPTAGLDTETARRYADFIEFMATDGQAPGDAITNLPPGYDPLPPAMRQQALDAARAVREQVGEVPPPPPGGPLGGGPAPGFPAGEQQVASGGGNPAPGAAVSPQGAAAKKSAQDSSRKVAGTKGVDSWLSRWALPLLVGFGVLAGLGAVAVQVASQPDHPVRRVLRRLRVAVRR